MPTDAREQHRHDGLDPRDERRRVLAAARGGQLRAARGLRRRLEDVTSLAPLDPLLEEEGGRRLQRAEQRVHLVRVRVGVGAGVRVGVRARVRVRILS